MKVTWHAIPPRIASSDTADIEFLLYVDASFVVETDCGVLGEIIADRYNFITHANRVDTIFGPVASPSQIPRLRAIFAHFRLTVG